MQQKVVFFVLVGEKVDKRKKVIKNLIKINSENIIIVQN